MKMGFTKGPLTWILVVGVCVNAAYTDAWGSYVCELKEQGLQKIEEICSESVIKLQSPLSVLESKMEKILNFVEEIKTAEDSWFHTNKMSGPVERDLSLHEGDDQTEEKDVEKRESDREDEDVNDRSGSESRNTRDEEETRTEDDYRQDRRERTYDWPNRRERTYERDSNNRWGRTDEADRRERTNEADRRERTDVADRRERTDEVDRQERTDEPNRRERTDDDYRWERTYDGDDRQNRTEEPDREEDREQDKDDDDDSRKKPEEEEKEEEPIIKKGECSTQVLDSHQTIGMFYMMSYQHGHCSNRNPVIDPIRYCLGYCTTKTFIERESAIWSQGNDCKSCQPIRFETLRIPLVCNDGFTFEKRFKNVVNCTCRRCLPVDINQRP